MSIIRTSALEGSNLEGEEHGATISVILDHSDPGQGPRLHRHPYDETWIVQEGTLTFQLDEERFTAGPGDIVIAPPGTPQVHERRPRTLESRLHPRQPDLQHRMARMTSSHGRRGQRPPGRY
jgi:quercetin dioxygenase-like cupin family protein